MHRPLRIGLDAHGVLASRNEIKSELARKLYNVTIPACNFHREQVLAGGLLTDLQYELIRSEVRKLSHEVMPEIPGALTYVPRLIGDGHQLFVITSNRESDEEFVMIAGWLQYHDLSIPLIGCGREDTKAAAVKEHNLDAFVDDSLVKLFCIQHVVRHRFLFSHSYNEGTDEGDVARRVYSWEQLYGVLGRIV